MTNTSQSSIGPLTKEWCKGPGVMGYPELWVWWGGAEGGAIGNLGPLCPGPSQPVYTVKKEG